MLDLRLPKPGEGGLIFSFNGPRECHVVLSEGRPPQLGGCYHIVVGAGDKNVSSIREGLQGPALDSSKHGLKHPGAYARA